MFRAGVFFWNHQHVDLKTGFLGADFKDLPVGVGRFVGDDEVGKQGQESPKEHKATGNHSEFVAAESFPSQCPWGLLLCRLAIHDVSAFEPSKIRNSPLISR